MDTVVAVLSLLLSVTLAIFYVRDRRHAVFAVENEYIRSLLDWHGEVVHVLARFNLRHEDRSSPEFKDDLATLYALIERGRFFFPNIEKGITFGLDKPPAYRGYRNLALDFLVAYFNLLHETSSEDTKSKMRLLQRHFTSVVFEVVRPKGRLDTIRRLTDRYFAPERTFEDFLAHKDGSVIHSIWRIDG